MITLTDILKASEYAHYHNLRYGLTEQAEPQSDTWVPGEGPEREFGQVEIKRFRNKKVQQAYDQYIAMLNLMNRTHAKNGHSVNYTYAEPNPAILGRPLKAKDYKDLTKQVEQDLRNDIKKFQTAEYIREKLTRAGVTHNFTNADILYEPGTLPKIRNAYATTQNKANGFTYSDFMAYYNIAGKEFDPEMRTLSADEMQNIKDMQNAVRHSVGEWIYEYRHELIDTAAVVALFIPFVGQFVSGVIELAHAYLYYEEGDTPMAVLYAMFAVLPGGPVILKQFWKLLGKAGRRVLTNIVIKGMSYADAGFNTVGKAIADTILYILGWIKKLGTAAWNLARKTVFKLGLNAAIRYGRSVLKEVVPQIVQNIFKKVAMLPVKVVTKIASYVTKKLANIIVNWVLKYFSHYWLLDTAKWTPVIFGRKYWVGAAMSYGYLCWQYYDTIVHKLIHGNIATPEELEEMLEDEDSDINKEIFNVISNNNPTFDTETGLPIEKTQAEIEQEYNNFQDSLETALGGRESLEQGLNPGD